MIGCAPDGETAVITSTHTAVMIPTLTATAVPTDTPTATATSSPTPSSTPTYTPTSTRTPTETPTPKPTRTPMATPTPASSGFDYDRYQPGTLASIIEEFEAEIESERDQNMLLYPYVDVRADVIYTGESRPISEERLAIWHAFLFAFLYDRFETLSSLYEMEFRFVENGMDYWLPVQSQLIPYLEDEAKVDQEITLFIKWIGVNSMADPEEIDWVFWVNEFWVDDH